MTTTLKEAMEESSDGSSNAQDRPDHWSMSLYQDGAGQKRPAVTLPDFPWSPLRRSLQIVSFEAYAPPKEQLPFIEIVPGEPEAFIEIVPEGPGHPDVKPGVRLFKFQQEAIDWLRDKPGAVLADEMGVGKTAPGIAWGAQRRPVLVICPASVVLNWAVKELGELWRRNDSVVVLDGQVDFPKPLPDWTVCSFGQVARYLGDIERAGYQAVIVDEAHGIRNLNTAQSKNVLDIVAPEEPFPGQRIPPYRLALTGTPIKNTPMDAFPLMLFVGLRTWDDLPGFRYMVKQRADEAPHAVYGILKSVMLRRKKADVYPDLPPKVHETLVVPITTADEYELAEGAFLEWLQEQEGTLHTRAQIEAEALVRLQALRGIAAMGKVAPVADWLTPCGTGGVGEVKALVFSTRIEPLEGLQRRHPSSILYTGSLSKEERQAFVDKFQRDPGLCYFMGTYGAAGVGITLTAADRVVLFDLPWTPADKQQAEDRAHRFGQKRTVEVYNVLAKNTVDERVLELLDEKEQIIASAVEGTAAGAAAKGSVAGELLRRLRHEASEPGRVRQGPYRYVSDDEAEAAWAKQQQEKVEQDNGSRSSLYMVLRQAVMGQPLVPLIPSLPELTEVRPLVFDTMLTRRRSVQLGPRITNPEDIVAALSPLERSDRERLFVLYLTVQNQVIGIQQAAIGQRSAALVPADAITRAAILSNAAAVILVHNHPGGGADPSPEDVAAARSLGSALKLMDVTLLDSLVMGGDGRYTSLAAKGLLTVGPMKQSTSDFSYPSVDSLLSPLIMKQIPDEWGSRCRDPLGRWTISDLCPPVPRGEIAATTMTFALSADGTRRYDFQHMVVEATDLITSHDPFTFEINPRFSQKLQPRKRERAATQIQVMRIAKELEPLSLLTDFRTFDRGAPIVGPDWLVESGNGRVMGYIRASQEYPARATAYQAALLEHISEFGLSAKDVQSKTLPMLIRMRVTPVTDAERQKFVEEANLPSGITRSAVEIARTDAERVTLDLLLTLEVGEEETLYDALKSMRNRVFIQRFLGTLPETERGQLLDSQGVVNLDGIRRIGQAVFVYVFRGETGLKLAELAFETLDNDIRNAFGGIARALGPMAQAEALTTTGARAQDLAIGEDLATTLRVYVRLRGAGTSLADYLAQGQLGSRELTPFQEDVLKTVASRARSAKRIGEVLRRYAESVIAQPPPQQTAMFGEVRVSKEELWQAARAGEQMEYEAETAERVKRREERELSPVAVSLRQAIGLEARDPKASVDWCNLDPERVDAAWAWRPFRDAIAEARGLRAKVQVCGSELSPDSYILSADFTGLSYVIGKGHGYSVATNMAAYRQRVKRALGENAHEVLEFGTNRVIFEVVLPGPEPEYLKFSPQVLPTLVPRREEGTMQPALFQKVSITEESRRLFEAYAKDAVNWSGNPLVGGNVGGSKEERGNLTQLKRAGLITTQVDGSDTWISFTPAGIEYATSLGIEIYQPRVEQHQTHSHSAPAQMLAWQYKSLLAELQLLQGHASDPSCPCALADIGEYCHAKHLLSISALAWETASMDSDPERHEMLTHLGDEANGLHADMRLFVHNPEDAKADVSLVEWSRTWRKKLETVYYSPALAEMHNVLVEQVIGSTISGLGWALGAALAGFVVAAIAKRREEREEEARRRETVSMSVPDLLATLDGLIQRLNTE